MIQININGKTITSFGNNITINNGTVYIDGTKECEIGNKSVEITADSIGDIKCDCPLIVNGDINGDLLIKGPLTVNGDITGNIDCEGPIMQNKC